MRLQLVKQGIHDQTMLMPNNHTVNITDNNDGTYNVDITLIKIAANIKVIVSPNRLRSPLTAARHWCPPPRPLIDVR